METEFYNDVYIKLKSIFNNDIDEYTLNKYATEIISKANYYEECNDEEECDKRHLNFIEDDSDSD